MLCNDKIREYSGQWSFLRVLGFFFLKFLYLCMYLFNACEYVCGRQMKTCRSQLPPSTCGLWKPNPGDWSW